MIPDLDLNDPAHLQQAKDYVQRESARFPLVGFDITWALLLHAEAATAFRQQVAAALQGLLSSIPDGDEESSFDEGMALAYDKTNTSIRAAATRLGIALPPAP